MFGLTLLAVLHAADPLAVSMMRSGTSTRCSTVIMERHAGRPLRWFFEQWLLQPGYPQLDLEWRYDVADQSVTARVRQVQDDAWGTFTITVPIRLEMEGRVLDTTADFAGGDEVTVRFDGVTFDPRGIVVDPEGDLLVTVTDSRRVN